MEVRLVVVEFGSNNVVVEAFGSKLVVGPSRGMTPAGNVVVGMVVVGVPMMATVGTTKVDEEATGVVGTVVLGSRGDTVFDAGTTGTVGAVFTIVVVVVASVDSPEFGTSGMGIGDALVSAMTARRESSP